MVKLSLILLAVPGLASLALSAPLEPGNAAWNVNRNPDGFPENNERRFGGYDLGRVDTRHGGDLKGADRRGVVKPSVTIITEAASVTPPPPGPSNLIQGGRP